MTPSDRRTISTLVLWGLAYLVARFAAELLERGSPLLLLLVILPAVPFALFLRALVASIRGADELERRIQLEALAVAFPVTLFLLMVLGLLELATELSPADWSYRHLWPFMAVFWILGQTIARRRYA